MHSQSDIACLTAVSQQQPPPYSNLKQSFLCEPPWPSQTIHTIIIRPHCHMSVVLLVCSSPPCVVAHTADVATPAVTTAAASTTAAVTSVTATSTRCLLLPIITFPHIQLDPSPPPLSQSLSSPPNPPYSTLDYHSPLPNQVCRLPCQTSRCITLPFIL